MVFCLMAFVFASFGTVSVTNHAGHVLSGELKAVTNGTFTIGRRTLPLKVLPESEQKRIKALAGLDVRTAKERQRAKMLDYQLRRIDVRLKEGEITESEAENLRRDARASAAFESTEKAKREKKDGQADDRHRPDRACDGVHDGQDSRGDEEGSGAARGLPAPQANIQLADALEKANCAPILVRMLREEPVFSGNH